MRKSGSARWAGLAIAAACFAPAAHAGLFDDDDARKAILDLRQKVEQGTEQRGKLSEQMTQQAEQMRRSLLDLNNQIELLRGDNAKLRGQNEQLARDVAELQVRQKDVAQAVDDRMRKLEPQKVTVDGKEFATDQEEKRQYDESMELLRKGDFAGTANALTAFRKRYPSSGYTESALFWLGNAQYGTRQYAPAIASFRALVSGSPEHMKAPEALLAIANCQAELKDRTSARRTLDELLRTYPKSEAALAGKERLASLK